MPIFVLYNWQLLTCTKFTERVPDVTASSARYPFKIALHQGAIESIFLDSMYALGVSVSRPFTPVSIQLSEDRDILDDVNAYPVKACHFYFSFFKISLTTWQVVLRRVDCDNDGSGAEVVYTKFVIGADGENQILLRARLSFLIYSIGAHSWVRKAFNIAMQGEQTESVWGVIDFTPNTNFPDIRNKCVIHSNNGTCMLIPREDDKIRLYIQLDSKDVADTSTVRVDKSQMSPFQLLDVCTISPPEFNPFILAIDCPEIILSLHLSNSRVF